MRKAILWLFRPVLKIGMVRTDNPLSILHSGYKEWRVADSVRNKLVIRIFQLLSY